MLRRMFGAALAAVASLFLLASPALAQTVTTYGARDYYGNLQQYRTILMSGVQFPAHVAMGVNSAGVPTFFSTDNSGNLNVNVISGGLSGAVTLGAGSSVAGKFGIDQTTPGTTNGVYVNGGSLGISGTPSFNCVSGCSGGSGGGAAWTVVGVANLNVTTTSVATALPTASTNLWLIDTGAYAAYYALGTSSSVTASVAASAYIGPQSCTLLTQGANTYIAALTASGSTGLQIQSGTGAPLGCGGGSGGGGGGLTAQANASSQTATEGASVNLSTDRNIWLRVRGEDGALVTMGSTGDTAATGPTGFYTLSATLKGLRADLDTLISNQANASTVLQGTNPWMQGCRVAKTVPTGGADGASAQVMCSPEGKLTVGLWAPEDLRDRGAGATASTTAQALTGWSAPASGMSAYIVSLQCGRDDTGTSGVWATLNDTASTPVLVPPGGATNVGFNPPLKVATTATAPTFTLSASVAGGTKGVACAAQGYHGN